MQYRLNLALMFWMLNHIYFISLHLFYKRFAILFFVVIRSLYTLCVRILVKLNRFSKSKVESMTRNWYGCGLEFLKQNGQINLL